MFVSRRMHCYSGEWLGFGSQSKVDAESKKLSSDVNAIESEEQVGEDESKDDAKKKRKRVGFRDRKVCSIYIY